MVVTGLSGQTLNESGGRERERGGEGGWIDGWREGGRERRRGRERERVGGGREGDREEGRERGER